MKTSNRILLGLMAIILLVVLTGMISVKGNLVPTGFGEGETEVFGSKSYKTIRPEVANFDKLDIAGNFDITLVPGNTFLEIEGEDNILDLLNIQVYPNPSGQLEIKAKEGYVLRPSDLIKLKIGFENLNSIHLMNEVKLTAATPLHFDNIEIIAYNNSTIHLDLTANKVGLQLQNASKVNLKGAIQKLDLQSYNSGQLEAAELTIQDAHIKTHNYSAVNLNVQNELTAEAYNYSKIRYAGNAEKIIKRPSNSASIKEIK